MGRSISNVVVFDERRGSRYRAPSFSASVAERPCSRKRPTLDNGGTRLPLTEDSMCSFTPPRALLAGKAATLGDALDGTPSGPKRILMKLRVNRGHASAQ